MSFAREWVFKLIDWLDLVHVLIVKLFFLLVKQGPEKLRL